MAKKNWKYFSKGGGFGTMVCCSCHQDATGKPFRVYEDHSQKDKGFVVQCRKCSKSAPEWTQFDNERRVARASILDTLVAHQEFREKFKTSSLDHDIAILEYELTQLDEI